MRIPLTLIALAGILVGLGAGCSDQCSGTSNAIIEAASATFNLSCNPNDLTNVVVTGPCNNHPDAGLQWYTGSETKWAVAVFSPSPGLCHIELIFATGFTYSADVTFTWQGECGQHYIGPTSGPFTVDNPSDTCLDAGTE